ncbi:MAG: hypothetical protein WBQ84_14705, partial [Methylocella sp.]
RCAISAGTSVFAERPGKRDLQSGTRLLGALEILECYVTVRRFAAAREFKPGPALRKRRGDRAKSNQKS